MDTTLVIKVAIGTLAGGCWLTLILLGKADAAPLVTSLQTILAGLAVHSISSRV